jgi:hypothetical protein
MVDPLADVACDEPVDPPGEPSAPASVPGLSEYDPNPRIDSQP